MTRESTQLLEAFERHLAIRTLCRYGPVRRLRRGTPSHTERPTGAWLQRLSPCLLKETKEKRSRLSLRFLGRIDAPLVSDDSVKKTN